MWARQATLAQGLRHPTRRALSTTSVVQRSSAVTDAALPFATMTQAQMVQHAINQEQIYEPGYVEQEVQHYFNTLGLSQSYFFQFSPRQIANHVISLIAAKKMAKLGGNPDHIEFFIERPTSAIYCCALKPKLVDKMEQRVLNYVRQTQGQGWSVAYYESKSSIGADCTLPLILIVAIRSSLPKYARNQTTHGREVTALEQIATTEFMRSKGKHIRQRFPALLNAKAQSLKPATDVHHYDNITAVMIAYNKAHSGMSYKLGLTEILRRTSMKVERKFIEKFANDVQTYTFYLTNTTKESIEKFLNVAAFLDLIPNSDLNDLMYSGQFAPNHLVYSHAACQFAYYFIGGQYDEYESLKTAFKNDPENLARVKQLRQLMKKDGMSHNRIYEVIRNQPQLVIALFEDFERKVNGETVGKVDESLLERISASAHDRYEVHVLRAFARFNACVLKTNFFQPFKAAVSFRLNPDFLKESDYPEIPFGVFMFMGNDFQGFHLRFRDIARGGIRLIRSNTDQQYEINQETLFHEVYSLASTQQAKNKDIPEGGSKGAILLARGFTGDARYVFQKYIDALLDVVLPNEYVRDNLGKPEIVFCGPDEGTAEFMDWAALHSKDRGYPQWKSLTTGKSTTIGGIPHDLYGMTTHSIRRFVLGVLEKAGLKEENVTKFMTGGPDGDLGSNEILVSHDKTIGVVDGSGVLFDPDGLNRTELSRIARLRTTVKDFDEKFLGPNGYKVLVTDVNKRITNDEVVENGLAFRNSFHLRSSVKADLFVPCGGRPEAINGSNVHQLFDQDGGPRFRFIVEGANLFITEDARLKLQQAGVVLFKDASANKGGVTSSSLEVLAGLAMTDKEYEEYMCEKDGAKPEFYQNYVVSVKEKIAQNADDEFECIWREHLRTKIPRTTLTTLLSNKINDLNDSIQASDLWNNKSLVTSVMKHALPQLLLDRIGIENVMRRVPDAYLRSIFGCYLASQYVYKYGLAKNEAAFWEFMQKFDKSA
eukprot:TRINITY_DN124_c1_g1_i15.p1 TRINITY_DN124_c1_g1~~TRINITY_DN124_c1_g1_i15.p1  ORF type:complete len:994 (-),score=265.99 TRINITY_DN124_c1_g1_i15:454-3435(-)